MTADGDFRKVTGNLFVKPWAKTLHLGSVYTQLSGGQNDMGALCYTYNKLINVLNVYLLREK
jgi:hypothetical protein